MQQYVSLFDAFRFRFGPGLQDTWQPTGTSNRTCVLLMRNFGQGKLLGPERSCCYFNLSPALHVYVRIAAVQVCRFPPLKRALRALPDEEHAGRLASLGLHAWSAWPWVFLNSVAPPPHFVASRFFFGDCQLVSNSQLKLPMLSVSFPKQPLEDPQGSERDDSFPP